MCGISAVRGSAAERGTPGGHCTVERPTRQCDQRYILRSTGSYIAWLLGAPLLFFGPDATRRLFEGEVPGRLLLYYALLGAYAAGLVGVCAAAYGSFLEEPAPRRTR